VRTEREEVAKECRNNNNKKKQQQQQQQNIHRKLKKLKTQANNRPHLLSVTLGLQGHVIVVILHDTVLISTCAQNDVNVTCKSEPTNKRGPLD
jgi:hypothetical protein